MQFSNPQPVYQKREPQIQSDDLSTPLAMGAISLAIIINQMLAIINGKSNGTILDLFTKTRNNYSLAVNSTEFLYQLVYFFRLDMNWVFNSIITSYAMLYI